MSDDFTPFGSERDLPGDPAAVASLGRRYVDTAEEIKAAAAQLRNMGTSLSGTWKGLGGKAFTDKAHDLANRIVTAEQRYRRTGEALASFARQAELAQAAAAHASAAGRRAQAQLDATAPLTSSGTDPLDAETTAAAARAADHAAALMELRHAQTAFTQARLDYDKAARDARHEITDASHDGLHDTWWYRNWHRIVGALAVIAIVVLAIAVVCLVLACPAVVGVLGALLGPALAATLGTALATTAMALDYLGACLAVTLLALDVDGRVEGHDVSNTTLALDALAVVTFGLSKGAERLVRGLTKGAEATAQSEVAAEASGRVLADYEELLGRAPTLLDYLMVDALRPVALERAAQEGGRALEALEQTLTATQGTGTATLRLLCRENPDEIRKLARLAELDPRFEVTLERALGISISAGLRQSVVDTGVTQHVLHDRHEEQQTDRRVEEIAEELRRHLLSTP